jgi:glycosyltransferase family protein
MIKSQVLYNRKIIFLILKKFISLAIFNFMIIIYYLLEDYRYCLKCIKNQVGLKYSKCIQCPNEYIFKNFHIIKEEGTLDEIINHNKSISRFGDGEVDFIFGRNIGYQRYNKKLVKRLKEILKSDLENLLIGINLPYKKRDKINYTEKRKKHFYYWFKRNKFRVLKLLKKNKKYYSSLISRFYIGLKDKSNASKIIEKLKKIWRGRDIVIVEGDKSRLGVGNDLFNNSKSIKRILCPSINAFNLYDKILKSVLKVNKKSLIIIALGPTATVLAYDLSLYGYQAIDIGHADIEYELYLRNASFMIPIPNKWVNEAKEGKKNITDVKDINYYNQIIDKILY